jgi:hypothetical protein
MRPPTEKKRIRESGDEPRPTVRFASRLRESGGRKQVLSLVLYLFFKSSGIIQACQFQKFTRVPKLTSKSSPGRLSNPKTNKAIFDENEAREG